MSYFSALIEIATDSVRDAIKSEDFDNNTIRRVAEEVTADLRPEAAAEMFASYRDALLATDIFDLGMHPDRSTVAEVIARFTARMIEGHLTEHLDAIKRQSNFPLKH